MDDLEKLFEKRLTQYTTRLLANFEAGDERTQAACLNRALRLVADDVRALNPPRPRPLRVTGESAEHTVATLLHAAAREVLATEFEVYRTLAERIGPAVTKVVAAHRGKGRRHGHPNR